MLGERAREEGAERGEGVRVMVGRDDEGAASAALTACCSWMQNSRVLWSACDSWLVSAV
jgi:hypothetical protein